MIEKRFNLIDEPWIPVAEKGLVSLQKIFSDTSIKALGGNPVEKIAVFKLLLAIAQSAYTPKDEDDWKQLGALGMKKKIIEYLKEQHDNFWLYSNKPFLQIPEIEKKAKELNAANKTKKGEKKTRCNGAFPDLYPNNSTIVTQYDIVNIFSSDEKKALFLITVLNFSLYGKQVNNKICLAQNFEKSPVAIPGPSLGFNNYMHSFGFVSSIIESVYFNIINLEILKSNEFLGKEIGTAFWEKDAMPISENCEIAQKSKETLIGHLIPLSRFVYFTNDSVYFTEGIIYHYSKKQKKENQAGANWIEQSFTWNLKDNEVSGLYADVNKRPWRELVTILTLKKQEIKYNNIALTIFFARIGNNSIPDNVFSVWTGGLDVSGDAFGQKIKETDDYVESEVQLSTNDFGTSFYTKLTIEMEKMDFLSKILYSSVVLYYKEFEPETKKVSPKIAELAKKATNYFWQLCEGKSQQLVTACEKSSDESQNMRPIFNSFALQVYDRMCPNRTARQMEAWAKNIPKIKKREDNK